VVKALDTGTVERVGRRESTVEAHWNPVVSAIGCRSCLRACRSCLLEPVSALFGIPVWELRSLAPRN
jgi:hypothetical protein